MRKFARNGTNRGSIYCGTADNNGVTKLKQPSLMRKSEEEILELWYIAVL
jgi:hypothetical protein